MNKKYTFDLSGRIEVHAESIEEARAEVFHKLATKANDYVGCGLVGTHTPATEPAPAPSLNPRDYCHIAVWGRGFGSGGGYIEQQQIRAAEEGAPLDAIYEREGTWVRVVELFDDKRKQIDDAAEELRKLLRKKSMG